MSSRKRKILTDPPSSSKAAKISAPVTTEVSVIEKRRESWKLSDDDANSAMALMKADGLTEEEMQDDLRVFLYAKGIMRDEKPVVRKTKFNDLLNPNGSVEARKKLTLARERLRRIVVKGEVGKNFDDEGTLFDAFVAKHPEWGPENSYVIFRDHELLKDKPHAYVERVQLSGLCYTHAPVILQHYLVAMFSDDAVPMLDMAVYLKKHMSAIQLERRIWYDEGGDSQTFLKSILMQQPAPVLLPRAATDEIESYLKSFGPALISRFEVEEAFDSADWQHLGALTTALNGFHAMVLVGVRKEGDSMRYLIQNWWKKKAFVEVDGQYLLACGAAVHFVQTRHTAMGAFPTNAHDHVECEMLDAQETHYLEGSF
ncbi:hypothetical protein MIR68_002080 [Amoeboaphelidium protococcarum]|nr:hypothetical protein MIR68_002080 [Amoeboaphelidium protococcarum]